MSDKFSSEERKKLKDLPGREEEIVADMAGKKDAF